MVGSPVTVRFRKWDGRQHWTGDALLLGADAHGTWLGIRPRTRWVRPGSSFVTEGHQVVLVPDGAGWVATFYEPVAGYQFRVYADITTPPEWDQAQVRSVDLDLDVIHRFDGEVQVLDEDEFALHRRQMNYPADLARQARADCAEVARRMTAGDPVFAEQTVAPWRSELVRQLIRPLGG